jgi:hypothetical protein
MTVFVLRPLTKYTDGQGKLTFFGQKASTETIASATTRISTLRRAFMVQYSTLRVAFSTMLLVVPSFFGWF